MTESRPKPISAVDEAAAPAVIAGEAYGTGLLLVIAVGFAAYGLFALTEARYREV